MDSSEVYSDPEYSSFDLIQSETVVLPEDIMEVIFGFLGPSDIKRGRLVNKLWRRILSQKIFWRWAELHIDFEVDYLAIIDSRMLTLVKSLAIDVRDIPLYDLSLIFSALEGYGVCKGKDIEFFFNSTCSNIGFVDLGTVMTDANCIMIYGNQNLTVSQHNSMFSSIANKGDLQLRHLKIKHGTLSDSKLDALTMSKALCRLHTVELYAFLSKEDIIILLSTINNSTDLLLRKLYLWLWFKIEDLYIFDQVKFKVELMYVIQHEFGLSPLNEE